VLAGLSFIEVPEAAESSVSEAPLSLPAPALKVCSGGKMCKVWAFSQLVKGSCVSDVRGGCVLTLQLMCRQRAWQT
jgi:hypothetical protein